MRLIKCDDLLSHDREESLAAKRSLPDTSAHFADDMSLTR
jgi:hypothetical protein